jgi:hypothetical protein
MKKKKKKIVSTGLTHQIRLQRKESLHEEKTNEEIEKEFELTGLTLQTRLTSQTWDSRHESLITE